MRVMGKRQIGEMQPFEFVITLIIADLACIPMADTSIPILYGVAAILAIFIMHQLMSILELGGNVPRMMLSGKPSVVINRDGVSIKELKKNNLDINDLIESMRSYGYFSLDDVDYAIFESNGKLSALEKEGGKKSQGTLPVILVNEGKVNKNNLELSKLTEKDVLELAGVKNKSKIEVLTVDSTGKAYLKLKNRKYEIKNITLKQGVSW